MLTAKSVFVRKAKNIRMSVVSMPYPLCHILGLYIETSLNLFKMCIDFAHYYNIIKQCVCPMFVGVLKPNEQEHRA